MSENNGNGILGTVIVAGIAFLGGIAVGMLFAPKSGKENRAWVKGQAVKLKDQATHLGHKVEEKLSKAVDSVKGKSSETMYDDEKSIYNDKNA